jgi:hypothetical protein
MTARWQGTKVPQATPGRLRDLAAVIGALAALAWPIVVLLIRVRRVRLKLGHREFEAEWVLREEDCGRRATDRGSSEQS